MTGQSPANWTAIAGTVAAITLGVIQAMHGQQINDNHELTHARIDGVEGTVMNKETISVHVAAFDKQQAVQDERLEALETEHPLHEHEVKDEL